MKEYLTNVLKSVASSMAGFFPYLFVFWLACLILSWAVSSWSAYFNWPAFHVGVLLFGVISLINNSRARKIPHKALGLIRLSRENGKSIGIPAGQLIRDGRHHLLVLIGDLVKFLKSTTPRDRIKSAVILIIMVLALLGHIGFLSFLVLMYACIAVLFMLDSRISASVALLLLILCPVALVFEKELVAEQLAVYAYYFLIITVVTQIVGLWYKTDQK